MKKEELLREVYIPPKIELLRLGQSLSYLVTSFSGGGGTTDWQGDKLEGEFEDGLEPEDWFGGGTADVDNG